MAFDDGSKVFDDVSLGNPSHDMDALSQTDTNGETVGVEYSFGRKKAALAACVGAKAFETSIWHWTPRHGEFASEEEPHLSVPREILGKYDDILSELPPLSGKLLCDSDRDRVVALVLAFCDRSNLAYVTPSLPSLCVLERLSHRFLQFQTAEPLPWFHVPTFCAASAPEELLLGIIAYGASLMPVKALQKLGKALPNILFDALKAKWNKDSTLTRNLQQLQSYTMILRIWFWCGGKSKMEMAEGFAQPIITILRRSGALRRTSWKNVVPDENDAGDELEHKWLLWVEKESWVRYDSDDRPKVL
ncbi:Fungal-trans domain-containing protein [Fusarium keratoplasticum]|nr:Fungal-trans domain-containing protein [Fusarium keratoplasticum]